MVVSEGEWQERITQFRSGFPGASLSRDLSSVHLNLLLNFLCGCLYSVRKIKMTSSEDSEALVLSSDPLHVRLVEF